MIYLVDTNVLLRFVFRNDPQHTTARDALRKLRFDGHQLRITVQNCAEFWNVSTLPANRNGYGLTPTETDKSLRLIERLFWLIPSNPAVYPEWRKIVLNFNVSGVQAHDVRLVANMLTHGITNILTFNALTSPDTAVSALRLLTQQQFEQLLRSL